MTKPVSFVARTRSFRMGSDSPVAAFDDHLEIIRRRENQVRAFVCLDVEGARRKAESSEKRWRSGSPLSPIDGMVVGVKDIIETVDFPTGQGLPALEQAHSGRDAASVAALRQAGAIIIGKTVTTELASTELFYPTKNAHDPERTPGGSSSGSAAAVGSAMVQLALASQVVGSTLRPASYNGAIGFKPTTGGLNRGGSYDYLSQSCVGIIGRDLDDVWVSAREIARRAGGDPGSVGLVGPDNPIPARTPARLAVLRTDGWKVATARAIAAFEEETAHFAREGVELVGADKDPLIAALESAVANALEKTWRILVWEMRWPLNTLSSQNVGISQMMRRRLSEGEAMTQADYAEALTEREVARMRLRDIASMFDGILTLSAVSAAPADFSTTGDPSFNVPASYLGAPALSLPLLEDGNMPLGLQVIGGQHQDAKVFAIAKWLANRGRDGKDT